MSDPMGELPLLSVVSPMWNEAESADAFLSELTAQLDALTSVRIEILIVDDGSTDGTHAILEQWAARRADLQVVSLSRNFGHQAAITAGVFAANGDAVVVLDSDLQDPPELIGQMVDGVGGRCRRRLRGPEGARRRELVQANDGIRLLPDPAMALGYGHPRRHRGLPADVTRSRRGVAQHAGA